MMKEHDIVVLTTDKISVPIGSKGTIVHFFPKGKAYLVEFGVAEHKEEIILLRENEVKLWDGQMDI